ncbi:MAG: heme-binding protein [Nitrospinota bacterium]
MPDTKPFLKLTHEGALKLLHAAVKKAEEMNVPQCIAVVDDGGHLLAFLRMDGAKVLSIDSSTRKAMTAASSRVPTSGVSKENELKLAHATGGKLTNLKGGVPIIIDGHAVGAIGVGSGTGEEDLVVAKAALKALEGTQEF